MLQVFLFVFSHLAWFRDHINLRVYLFYLVRLCLLHRITNQYGDYQMSLLNTDTTTLEVAAKALAAFEKSFPDEITIWIKQEPEQKMQFIIKSIPRNPKKEDKDHTGASVIIKRKWLNDEGIFINSTSFTK